MTSTGYEKHKCQFNFPGCQKTHAGYGRRENDKPKGPFLDACEKCARVPYPQPKQFQEEQDAKDNTAK